MPQRGQLRNRSIEYEPVATEDGILFPDIYFDGEVEELRTLAMGDLIEFRGDRYQIISLSGPSRGDTGKAYRSMIRSSVRCRKFSQAIKEKWRKVNEIKTYRQDVV